MKTHKVDIMIIGAGMTGLTLALALAENDCRIIVVDASSFVSNLTDSPDLRVTAINHASHMIFSSLGVWDAMQLRIGRYENMHVWDENSPAKIQFDCTEIGQPYLGHIIEHSIIKAALLAQLKKKENVQIIYSAQPVKLQESVEKVVIQLNNGEMFEALLLVGADGSHSWVAHAAGLPIVSKPYHHSALVTTVQTASSHQHTAWQRFLTKGALAFLPLEDVHQSSIVWSTSPDQAIYLQNLSEEAFNHTITSAFEHKLGEITVSEKRIVFPLQQRHAKHYVKPRIALIGDAAHSIHPLAGQGVNLGLLDAACLAEVIDKTIKSKRDIGHITPLRRYERWRKGENQLMIAAMAGFKQLFGNQLQVLQSARHLGFAITHKLPWLKNYFMERAMGLRGDLPERAV